MNSTSGGFWKHWVSGPEEDLAAALKRRMPFGRRYGSVADP
jgi:hypothetical protein